MHLTFPTIASYTNHSCMHTIIAIERMMTSVTKHFFFSQPAALPPIDNIGQLFVDIVQTSPITRLKMQWQWHKMTYISNRKRTRKHQNCYSKSINFNWFCKIQMFLPCVPWIELCIPSDYWEPHSNSVSFILIETRMN